MHIGRITTHIHNHNVSIHPQNAQFRVFCVNDTIQMKIKGIFDSVMCIT